MNIQKRLGNFAKKLALEVERVKSIKAGHESVAYFGLFY